MGIILSRKNFNMLEIDLLRNYSKIFGDFWMVLMFSISMF